MSHPYEQLPSGAFWRTAVADQRPHSIADLWTPKFAITRSDKIATFGSCFAQHISRSLVEQNYTWFDAEPPDLAESGESSRERGYGIFSARTGNIYTSSALRQWIEWATGAKAAPNEVWEKNARYFDPFRPAIEPAGFSSPAHLFASREATFRTLREVIERADCFVFTLGLTEGWIHRDGYTYATCPGTGPAGEFDASQHRFKNLDYSEVLADMSAVLDILRSKNENICLLLTVSPVPLTATASGQHVLAATTYSKSVLRAVAGHLAATQSSVDYFPSYEIITGAPFRSRFYESNLRSVTPDGVAFVMRHFFAALGDKPNPTARPLAIRPPRSRVNDAKARNHDVVCEEIMLDAFAPESHASIIVPDADAAKICIVGNSHAVALREALRDGHFADSKLDLMFWAFAGRSYGELKFDNGTLTHPNKKKALAQTGGRYEGIDPKDFDALVFVGPGFKPGLILPKLHHLGELDPFGIETHLRRRISNTPELEPMLKVGRHSQGGRIYFVPWPMPPESSGRAKGFQIGRQELEQFNRIATKIFAESHVKYTPQPAETIQDNKWTKNEFSRGTDFMHMNGKYGALILNTIRREVRPNPGEQTIRVPADSVQETQPRRILPHSGYQGEMKPPT